MHSSGERSEMATRAEALEARERTLEQTWERKYTAKIHELEQRAAQLSAQFEQRAQETIEELSQKARAKISRTRREYQEAVEAIAPTPLQGSRRRRQRLKLEAGARVRLKGIRQAATVRRVLSNGLLEVDAGFLKMQVVAFGRGRNSPGIGRRPAASGISFHQGPRFEASYSEINVIGQRAEAACEQVDKLLDSAALGQVERVRIVHGHGMGILKRAIADLLKQNPHVEKFYSAAPEEGGSGATIVEMRA